MNTNVAEIAPLAAIMHQHHRWSGTYYRMMRGLASEEELGDVENRVRNTPSESMEWSNLNDLAGLNAEAALETWERIKAHARAELNTGHRAAEIIAKDRDTPMDRARFLVLRESFIEEWQPRGGIELNLIDQMAQAYTMYAQWNKTLTERTQTDAAEDRRLREKETANEWRGDWRRGEWVPARVTVAEAVNEAMAMVDRWNRLYHRAVRQLRDMRRYNVQVNVNNAAQVNVGEKQVNISPAASGEATAQDD